MSAAFVRLFNHGHHPDDTDQKLAQLSKEFRASISEARQLGMDGDIDGDIARVGTGGIWDFKNR